jgi:hypothetical protein
MSNEEIKVVTDNTMDEVVIPFRPGQEEEVKQQVVDIQMRFAEVVAKECGIDIDNVKDCFPKNIVFKQEEKKKSKSKKSNSNKLALEKWAEATCIEELKTLKLNDLKDILKSSELKTSGSKEVLANRVWGINHPADAPVESIKKRGRPKGTKKSTYMIVSDTDEDVSAKSKSSSTENNNIEELLENSIEMDINGTKYSVVMSKQWVFSIDNEGDFTWEGILNNDGDNVDECDPPDELMKFYEE